MSSSKHNILIVGGGFAGIKATLELSKDPRFSLTLINEQPDFWYYGTLYHTATGGSRNVSSIALSEVFQGKPVNVIIDKATTLDRKIRTVTTQSGAHYTYDGLVLGLGVTTNFFHIEGLEQFAYGIKSPKDAEALKVHLHKQLVDDNQPDLNYVVVGGGPTGIELAGVLGEYMNKISKKHRLAPRKIHVDLVEAAPRLLPRMPKDLSRRVARHLQHIGVKLYLKTAVQAQTAEALMINGKPIRSHTVIWTAGMTNNPFFAENQFQLARNGKVRVDQFLQSEPGIYVLGDNADTPYSGMAQTALYDGQYVARNLMLLADNSEPQPYRAKKPIYVMPAGSHWAAVLWGPLRIYGRPGWWLRRAADLIAYHDYEPTLQATRHWLAEYEHQDLCPYCDMDMQPKVS